jgi:hypothetical protein
MAVLTRKVIASFPLRSRVFEKKSSSPFFSGVLRTGLLESVFFFKKPCLSALPLKRAAYQNEWQKIMSLGGMCRGGNWWGF